MILLGLDTEKRGERRELAAKIWKMALGEAQAVQTEVDAMTKKILAERPLTEAEKSIAETLEIQLGILAADERRAALGRQKEAIDSETPAQGLPAPQAQPEPPPNSWEALKVFAKRLPRQRAKHQPHSVQVHLKQRLGKSQGERPPVRARIRGTDKFDTVTAANFQALLSTAEQDPWRPPTKEERERLAALVANMKPTIADSRRLDSPPSALYSKLVVKGDAEGNKILDAKPYQKVFEAAWRTILETVDKEVLTLIELPNAFIYMADAEIFGGRPACYDERTQSMYLKSEVVSEDRIRHEFGHHIEDQGPVEIWRGLAALLQSMSAGKDLEPPEAFRTREPRYALDWDAPGYLGLPKVPYTASYYEDAGTELLSSSLEDNILGNLKAYIEWPANSRLSPEFTMLLLHALRPHEMREAGLPNPALL